MIIRCTEEKRASGMLLLVQPTVDEMIYAERKLLNREKTILEQTARTQDEQREGGYSGFLTQN